ncbi:hypothetical protein FRB94_001787 [Tulasnella sp. JGI-2019a]|nr:hypothetical protein FRB94_001787 [Tulasnella sp. JGI-2019a]
MLQRLCRSNARQLIPNFTLHRIGSMSPSPAEMRAMGRRSWPNKSTSFVPRIGMPRSDNKLMWDGLKGDLALGVQTIKLPSAVNLTYWQNDRLYDCLVTLVQRK